MAKQQPIVTDNRQRITAGMIPVGRITAEGVNRKVDAFFLPGEVRSQKNSREVRGGKVIHSALTAQWYEYANTVYKRPWQEVKKYFAERKLRQAALPVFIGLHFVRVSRQRFDQHNMVHIILDHMVDIGALDDDDVSNVFTVPMAVNGAYASYCKASPGVILGVYRERYFDEGGLSLSLPPATQPFPHKQ